LLDSLLQERFTENEAVNSKYSAVRK